MGLAGRQWVLLGGSGIGVLPNIRLFHAIEVKAIDAISIRAWATNEHYVICVRWGVPLAAVPINVEP